MIIQQFQAQKGTIYIPKNVHPAIFWKHANFMFIPNAAISPWQIIKNTKAKSEAFKPSKSNLLKKQETTHEVSIFCQTNKKS